MNSSNMMQTAEDDWWQLHPLPRSLDLYPKPLTCDKDFFHGVALHVPSTRDEGHFILCVRPQVSNRILVFIFREVDGCPVPWNILGAVSELYAFDVSQGFGPCDKSRGVCDIFCLDLARGIKLCYKERRRCVWVFFFLQKSCQKNTHSCLFNCWFKAK